MKPLTIEELSVGDRVLDCDEVMIVHSIGKKYYDDWVETVRPPEITGDGVMRISSRLSNGKITRIPVTAEKFPADKKCFSIKDGYVSEWSLSAVLKNQGDVFLPLQKDPQEQIVDINT